MTRRAHPEGFDAELTDLPPAMRWREWMGRVEAVIFASAAPVPREVLAKVVGRDCNLDLIIEDIKGELKGRPYELDTSAGGWQHRTRPNFAGALRASGTVQVDTLALSKNEMMVLCGIAYFQPITRGQLSNVLGRAVRRDTIGVFKRRGFIDAGPRSPEPGAPYTYVTTTAFLDHFGYQTLRDMPDMEMLEDAGLLSKDKLLAGEFPDLLGENQEEPDDPAEDVEEDLAAVPESGQTKTLR